MKRLLILAVCLVTACSGGDFIASRAELFVRKTYNDVDRILSVGVDTVTYGDNLEYRIEMANRDVEFAERMFQSYPNERNEKDLMGRKAWVAALDSLKAVSGSVLDKPAAYNCIVVYNNPGNITWVQLDEYGNLQNITKEVEKLLLNPGHDVPGYLDVWKKYRK